MLTDIHMKFLEDILNGFQVIEWTLFYEQSCKGYNSKSINARVRVLHSASCLLLIDIYMKFLSWRYLEQVSSYRADTIS